MEGKLKKIKNNTIMIPLILGVMCINSYSYAADKLQTRELDTDFLDITEVNQTKDSIYKSEDIKKIREKSEVIDAPTLKGGVSELRAIVGKSQILKFDEPIKRFSITKPELVDIVFLSPKELIMNGKTGGETTVIIWGEGEEPVFFNLFVENNNITIVKEIKKIAPNEDIKIDFVDSGTDSGLKIMLSGKLSSTILKGKIDELAKAYNYSIVDLTEAYTPQIMLEVKIVEMGKTKNKSREFEFKQGLFDYLEMGEALAGSQALLKIGTKEFSEPWSRDLAWENLVNISEYAAEGQKIILDDFINKGSVAGNSFTQKDGLSVWRMYPNKNLSYRLNNAEGEGLIKILAEPKIMIAHKTTAHFESGTQVPLPREDALGNTVGIEYKSVGIIFDITPTLLEETERIGLDIQLNVSDLSTTTSSSSAPAINSRISNTKVEVANNQTTVISGLTRKAESTTTTKFPYLSNLPMIGKFFDSTTSTQDETEVMIFVTPSIVKPDLAEED